MIAMPKSPSDKNRMRAIHKALAGALFATLCSAAAPALAAPEVEPNSPIVSPQTLAIGADGTSTIEGVVGLESGTPINDVDFFTFEGSEGDVVTIDIDGGMKLAGAGRNVDTILAIFDPRDPVTMFKILRLVDDVPTSSPLDDGSISRRDARIDNFRLPASGSYVVGVSSFPRRFTNGGGLTSTTVGNLVSNGGYTLIVSGVTPPIQQINIEIKPGSGDSAPINPKSRGNIPVALLSSSEFDARTIDVASTKFGATGNEASMRRCDLSGADVNNDGYVDVVCHFDSQASGFAPGDLEGIVHGKTTAGKQFEGRGVIYIVPGNK